jgi:hypothetical protein
LINEIKLGRVAFFCFSNHYFSVTGKITHDRNPTLGIDYRPSVLHTQAEFNSGSILSYELDDLERRGEEGDQVVTMGAAREDVSVEPLEENTIPDFHHAGSDPGKNSRTNTVVKKAIIIVVTCVILYGSYTILFNRVLSLGLAGSSQGIALGGKGSNCDTSSTKVPQYFQTSPELWAGPTATGRPPFLAQTNPVSFAPTATFAANTPLETAEPIVGQGQNESIFHLMAHLSPYFPNPSGFGVAEYPLPPGANISQLQVSRELIPSGLSY